jgi:sporulation protein YlmC with PRC-barrel domain
MNNERKVDIDPHLFRLNDLNDYEVADRDPDVRGWLVYSAEGIKFGKIVELIVDPDAMKVRYLDIEVDEGVEGVTDERRLLVPIGVASVDEKDDKVFIRTIQTVSLLKTPPYKGGVVTRDYEDTLRRSFLNEKERPLDEDYYSSDYYNEENFYKPRRKKNDPFFLLSGAAVIGERVSSRNDDYIGKIEEIMIDVYKNKIAYVVVSFTEEFLDLPDKYYAIPWEVLNFDKSKNKFYIDIPAKTLKNALIFDKENLHLVTDRDYLNKVYNYYGIKPYR